MISTNTISNSSFASTALRMHDDRTVIQDVNIKNPPANANTYVHCKTEDATTLSTGLLWSDSAT